MFLPINQPRIEELEQMTYFGRVRLFGDLTSDDISERFLEFKEWLTTKRVWYPNLEQAYAKFQEQHENKVVLDGSEESFMIGRTLPFHHTMPTEELNVKVRTLLERGTDSLELAMRFGLNVEWQREFSVAGKGTVKAIRYNDNQNRSNEICLRISK